MKKAIDSLYRIIDCESLYKANLKYCLVDDDKIPYRYDNTKAKPDQPDDFMTIEQLTECDLEGYAGIGVSVQASKICAIDVDDCFKVPFDINTKDERATQIIEWFKDIAYIEFSFSGCGMRILFRNDIIEDYKTFYYIKNSKNHIEYYQPSNESYRYVTLTGMCICENEIKQIDKNVLKLFLDTYMTRPKPLTQKDKQSDNSNEERTFEQLWERVKYLYMKDSRFQDLVFTKPPGSNSDESERDFYIISYIYNNVTKNKEMVKKLFENTYYFKHKDHKHIYKWEYNNYRYYNWMYERL